MKRILAGLIFLALSLPGLAQYGGIYTKAPITGTADVASLIAAPCATSAAVLYNSATPCSANLLFEPTGSLLTIGADVVVSRYGAKRVMISGDGVGATTNAGLIAGYHGTSNYGALWSSTVVPTTANHSFFTNGTNSFINAITNGGIDIGNVNKFLASATLNTSVNPLSITDATDSSSPTTGSLKTAGGLGVAKKAYFGDVVNIAGDVQLSKTITAPGTTGAQTINKTTGRVNFAALATSLVVTNNLVTANSICHVTKATNDSTMRLGACVASAGAITIYADVAPAAEAAVNFTVTN